MALNEVERAYINFQDALSRAYNDHPEILFAVAQECYYEGGTDKGLREDLNGARDAIDEQANGEAEGMSDADAAEKYLSFAARLEYVEKAARRRSNKR